MKHEFIKCSLMMVVPSEHLVTMFKSLKGDWRVNGLLFQYVWISKIISNICRVLPSGKVFLPVVVHMEVWD